MKLQSWLFLCIGALSIGALSIPALSNGTTPPQDKEPEGGKYLGVKKCKSCHRSKRIGNQYGIWKKNVHAHAYEVLGTDRAKEVAKKYGLSGDPQKAPECLKCHVTAYGVDKKYLGRKFRIKDGIQCETCHGPGEKHVEARLNDESEDDKAIHEAAKKEMPLHGTKVCHQCHNEKSPSITESKYWDPKNKVFKAKEAFKSIEHPNPKWKK